LRLFLLEVGMLISTLELFIAVYIQGHPIIRAHGIGAVLVESEFAMLNHRVLGFTSGVAENFVSAL
jgi:hypothetical protein